MDLFVERLCAALQTIVPSFVYLRSDDGCLIVGSASGSTPILIGHMFQTLRDSGSTWKDALESATLSALEQLQEIITRELHTPWPTVSGETLSQFAPPHIEIRGETLFCSYTTRDRAATPELSISLAELCF